MFKVTVFLKVVLFSCIVSAQQGPCTQGLECKSVYNCPALLDLVNKQERSEKDIETLRKAHCGFEDNVPAVCCPGPGQPLPVPTDQCYTPEGKTGKCISLYSCPELANLLRNTPVPKENIQYIRNSKCNGLEEYSVCCGPVPDLKNVKRVKCQSTRSAFPPDPRTTCCGVDGSAGNKVYGGTAVSLDQHPWLVLIEYLDSNGDVKTLCGGALISSRYVLTAAHCVVGQALRIGKPSAVRLGEYDTSNEGPDCAVIDGGDDYTEGTITIPIEKIIPHPQYNHKNALKWHDIALIRMAEMANYTDFIRPICLPTEDMTLRSVPLNLTAAGWGAVSLNQSSSPIKLEVDLPYVPLDQCQKVYEDHNKTMTLWNGQLCAGGIKGKDSCNGDSGGPLMYEDDINYQVIGIISFGRSPCGLQNVPGVYTNVYQYNTWIRNNITP